MRTGQLEETLLPKWLALPIFASDPLSSVAYATESALVVLVGVSATAGHLVLPIAAAIAVLLAVVVLSYMQTVHAYETSGGARRGAREPRDALEPRGSGCAAHRLRADGRGLHLRRDLRGHVVRSLTCCAQGRPVARVSRAHRAREPPRRSRSGLAVRAADVCVRRRDRLGGRRRLDPGADRSRAPRRHAASAPRRTRFDRALRAASRVLV